MEISTHRKYYSFILKAIAEEYHKFQSSVNHRGRVLIHLLVFPHIENVPHVRIVAEITLDLTGSAGRKNFIIDRYSINHEQRETNKQEGTLPQFDFIMYHNLYSIVIQHHGFSDTSFSRSDRGIPVREAL